MSWWHVHTKWAAMGGSPSACCIEAAVAVNWSRVVLRSAGQLK